jgi:hypothetical protein
MAGPQPLTGAKLALGAFAVALATFMNVFGRNDPGL